jgi:Tol biopolymer transport system component
LILGSDAAYGGEGNVFTIRPDGTGKTYLTEDGPGYSNREAAWSYDGSKIVYIRQAANDLPRLWIMAADGSGKQQLTFGGLGADNPTFSPDGRSILFTGFTTGTPELWVMNADGSHQITSTTGREVAFESKILQWSLTGSYSPDGTKIAFGSTQSGNVEIWIANADGSDPVQVTFAQDDPSSPDANAPSWSPDGSKIVFWSGIAHGYGNIFTMNPDGTGRTQLTFTPAPESSDNPIWAANGQAILFDTNRDGSVETWIMNIDGSGQHALFPGGYGGSRLPVVSNAVPDGYQIVGVGDFHGNGWSDILLRNPTSGDIAELRSDQGMTFSDIGWAGPGWEIAGTTDLNGDGTTDIVLQFPGSGAVGAFIMSDGHPTWALLGST